MLVLLKYLFVIAGFVILFFQVKSELYKMEDISNIYLPNISFRNFGLMICLLISIALNWSLEALKWKYISPKKSAIDFFTAFKHVLISLSAGISTPYRAGEIAARSLLFPKETRFSAGIAALLNSFMQFTVTILVGYFFLFPISSKWHSLKSEELLNTFWAIVLVVIIFVVYALWLGLREKLKSERSSFAYTQILILLILSVFRYLVFILQYYTVFEIFEISIGFFDFLSGMAVVFFVLYLLPVIQLADIGVRGTVAVFIFSPMAVSALQITIIFFVVWILAIVLPALVGIYYLSRQKINTI